MSPRRPPPGVDLAVTPADVADGLGSGLDDATLWERRMRALTMRNAGATFAKIAETLGISTDQARTDVRSAIREVVAIPVDQMVERQRAILLDLTRVNYPAALAGDRDAQVMLLRALEHEAKLYGLYAPARVNVGLSEVEFARQAAELLSAIGTEPLRELAGVQRIEPPPLQVIEQDGSAAHSAAPDGAVGGEPAHPGGVGRPDQETPPEPDGWSNL